MENNVLSAKPSHLLVVEDDHELSSLIQEYLAKNGFTVDVVGNGLEAVAFIKQRQPDLVILDIMLPGISGMDVCKEVRPFFHAPILMLTALDEDIDQMLGLELGADDYVIKPIKPRLLLSRVRALLRRAEQSLRAPSSHIVSSHIASNNQPQVHPISVNMKLREVKIADRPIVLTTAEFDLLKLLVEDAGNVVSRDIIVQSLRGFDYDGLDRSIDRRISRLRKKLEQDPVNPQFIRTARNVGYILRSNKRNL
jgi:DNA-binding response OmpR family regulator